MCVNLSNILQTAILYKTVLRSFSVLTAWVCNFLTAACCPILYKEIIATAPCKLLMKLITGQLFVPNSEYNQTLVPLTSFSNNASNNLYAYMCYDSRRVELVAMAYQVSISTTFYNQLFVRNYFVLLFNTYSLCL